jgi:uncharacterized protein (TIGR03546 family)
MLSPVVAILRRVLQALLRNDSPGEIAAGFTLGLIIGLVPKGTLVAVSLCVLLFSLRVNKGLGLAAAIVFSALGPGVDAFSHKLGLMILGTNALQPVYAAALSLPLGPWIGFHNTVVTGSLALGLYIAYPVYWSVRAISVWLQPSTSMWLRRPGGAT